jgi:hypothetical protein
MPWTGPQTVERRGTYVDLVYLAIVFVFFGLSQGLIELCDRLR